MDFGEQNKVRKTMSIIGIGLGSSKLSD